MIKHNIIILSLIFGIGILIFEIKQIKKHLNVLEVKILTHEITDDLIIEIKKEKKLEPIYEIKDEPIIEIKEEKKDDIKDEPIIEIKEEPIIEIKQELKEELKDYELKEELKDYELQDDDSHYEHIIEEPKIIKRPFWYWNFM